MILFFSNRATKLKMTVHQTYRSMLAYKQIMIYLFVKIFGFSAQNKEKNRLLKQIIKKHKKMLQYNAVDVCVMMPSFVCLILTPKGSDRWVQEQDISIYYKKCCWVANCRHDDNQNQYDNLTLYCTFFNS